MFLGESLCLVPYFILRWRKAARRRAGLEPESKRPKQPRSFFLRRALMFAIPALCDSVASTLLNLGLFYTVCRWWCSPQYHSHSDCVPRALCTDTRVWVAVRHRSCSPV